MMGSGYVSLNFRRATSTILDFVTNMCTMTKLHLDGEHNAATERAVLLAFNNNMGKKRTNNGSWVEDADYDDDRHS